MFQKGYVPKVSAGNGMGVPPVKSAGRQIRPIVARDEDGTLIDSAKDAIDSDLINKKESSAESMDNSAG